MYTKYTIKRSKQTVMTSKCRIHTLTCAKKSMIFTLFTRSEIDYKSFSLKPKKHL